MKHDEGNALTLEPGETKELIWQCGKPGTVEIACHVPGHYEAGMIYLIETLSGFMGDKRRWRTMPRMVLLFGIAVVPLGAVSIFFIIIQPITIGPWCTLRHLRLDLSHAGDRAQRCADLLRGKIIT